MSWRQQLFLSLAGGANPPHGAGVALRRAARAVPSLFGDDTALIGGVSAGGFGLLCGTAVSIFFDFLAGKFAPLLHGEIGIYAISYNNFIANPWIKSAIVSGRSLHPSVIHWRMME